MKLGTKQDIEAPIAFVYDVLVDFEGWERAAMRRGADVMRSDTLRVAGPGMGWNVQFAFRGKTRKMAIKLVKLDRPQHLAFSGLGSALDGTLDMELVELGAKRTRVTVVTEVKPRTLAARILLQSVKLAKGKISKKYAGRVALVAADIEDRYKRSLRG
jgi:carbon monoxide dehydrogenase subunit G